MTSTGGSPATLDRRTRYGYATGSVATGAFGTVPGLMLLPFLTDQLGVAALWAGVIVFLPKAWDVILNPIAGRISDRTVDPRGPRRPWLLRGGILLAILFAVIFAGPALGSPTADAVWVLVAFLACATAYAFFQVPYVAMPAELTSSYDERTRMMSSRVAVLAFTILLAGATAPAIRDAVGGRDGYRVMGVLMAGLILVGVIGSYVGTRGPAYPTVRASTGGLRAQFAMVSRVRDFRLLLTTFVVQALAVGSMLAGVDYLAGDVLEQSGATTILFVCFVGPALVLTPLWVRFGTRYGKRLGYLAASTLLALGATLVFSSLWAPTGFVFAAVAVVGIGYTGAQVFPMAMLPDVAAADARRHGENRIGVFTGVWTAGETLGLALGPGLFAVLLALGDYQSSTTGGTDQPDSAVTAIVLGMSLLPALLIVLSLWWLTRYRLTEEDL